MKKILLIDDHPLCRELLSAAIQHRGYEVLTAANGLDAVAAVKNHHPDLLILEATLSHMDGLAVLRIIRSIPEFKNLPIFMLSNVEERSVIIQAKQIGVQEYILKSTFSLAAVLARIEKTIGPPNLKSAASPIADFQEPEISPHTNTSSVELPGKFEKVVSGHR